MKKSFLAILIGFILLGSVSYGENKKFQIEFIEIGGAHHCNVDFFHEKPKPETIDKMLRTSLRMAAHIDSSKDILGMAFFEGNSLSSREYSGKLMYVADKKKIMSYKKATGTKTETLSTDSYFVIVEEVERSPNNFLSIDIVFPETPSMRNAYKAIEKVAKKVSDRQLEANLYVYAGNKNKEITWEQVKDKHDKGYIFAEYDPQTRSLRKQGVTIKQLE